MGWFSRKSDRDSPRDSYSDGLYTGDAPVSVPGADGRAPTEYRSTQQSGTVAPAPDWNADAPPEWPPPTPARPTSTESTPPPWQPAAGAPPAGYSSAGYRPPPWQPDSAPPWQPGGPPPPTAGAGSPPPWTPGQPGRPPMMSVQDWQQFGLRMMTQVDTPIVVNTRRTNRVFGLVVFLIVAGVAAAIAIPVIAAVTSIPSFSADDPPKSVTSDAVIGTPAAATYRSAELQVTLAKVTAQPVDSWRAGSSEAIPTLVAQVALQRQSGGDDTSGHVSVMAWDWHFQPVEGPAVSGELTSMYEPRLSSPDLGPGDKEAGLVSFVTAARSGTLWLEDPQSDERVAVWEIAKADVPATVTGKLGSPAQGQIGQPQFAVTAQKTEWLGADDPDFWSPPENGAALRVSMRVAAVTGVPSTQYLGQLGSDDFWFVPAKGEPVVADYSLMPGTTSVLSVYGGMKEPMVVAFDVAKGPGTLELRDAAGLVVIRWPVK